MASTWFGTSVLRKEDPALLTGRGQFVDDIHLPGMLHAAFVRSAHAHARIVGIDTAAARAAAGVHLVLTHADLPESMRTRPIPVMMPNPIIKQPFMPLALAAVEVCFVGEPVAVVVADSRYVAEDAAALVTVEYDPLPVVTDCRAAIEPDSPPVHLGSPSNIAARLPVTHGAVEAAFAGAPHVFRDSFHLHRGGAFFIECRGVVAEHDAATDSYTLHVTSQGSHRIKEGILDLLDVSEHQIRVITPDVGGGFGEGFRTPAVAGRAFWAWGRRTKTAQARTRGDAAMVYGDFEFCSVEVVTRPARRWRCREVGK